jgi:hypothetical protein
VVHVAWLLIGDGKENNVIFVDGSGKGVAYSGRRESDRKPEKSAEIPTTTQDFSLRLLQQQHNL